MRCDAMRMRVDRAATHGLRGGEKGKGESWRGDFEERMLMSTCSGESRPEMEGSVCEGEGEESRLC